MPPHATSFYIIPQDRLVLYMNDFCVVSKAFDEHRERLQAGFDSLRQHDLSVKARKCYLAMDEVTLFEHRITVIQ